MDGRETKHFEAEAYPGEDTRTYRPGDDELAKPDETPENLVKQHEFHVAKLEAEKRKAKGNSALLEGLDKAA